MYFTVILRLQIAVIFESQDVLSDDRLIAVIIMCCSQYCYLDCYWKYYFNLFLIHT
jgi:hypothetical protein